MSIIRSIKHRLGLSVTPANNFVLDASADNGTMKLARESGQDIMTVDAVGKVSFSVGILGFSYSTNGTGTHCVSLPSWLGKVTFQWGLAAITATSGTASLLVAMGDSTYKVFTCPEVTAGSTAVSALVYGSRTPTQFAISLSAGTLGIQWFVIGIGA